MPRPAPGAPIGRITGVSSPDSFIFTFDPNNPVKLYDYVMIDMVEEPPDSESPVHVKVVAQVYRVERASLGLSPDHPWPVVREYSLPLDLDTPRAYAKVLGYKWRGRILRPRSAPPVGSWVYVAPDELLRDFYSVEETRRLHIGYLISRPSVPAYLDVEGIKRHVAIIAATGSGKTWTSVVLIEELLKKNATILVIDPHGEYVAMKRSACEKAREFCNRIRVIKGHPDQEGDQVYRVDINSIDGVTLADIAGVPKNAKRIREIIISAKSVAEALVRATGRRELGSLDIIVRVMELAYSASIAVKRPSALHYTRQLLSQLAAEGKIPSDKVDEIRETLESDRGYREAVEQLLISVGKSVEALTNAKRYLWGLRRIGIYSTTSIPLDELLSPGTATVVNLAGLPTVMQDHIVSNILERVFQARVRAARRLPGEKYEYPVVVIVEEAHRFIPARRERVETRSLPIAAMIASEGRKFGVFLVVITQRPSRIDQDVLSQAQTHIILRIVNVKDQQAVREASEQLSQDLFENLPGLNPGEAIIVGPMAPIPMMVRVRDRVLDYAGKDISLVEAWGSAGEIVKRRREVEEELAARLSDILAESIEPQYVREALANLLGVEIPLRVYMRALRLVAENKVSVYRYSPQDLRVYARVDDYEVEVGLWGGVRRCDCGADSTEREDAICEHMVAALAQAVIEGLINPLSRPMPRGVSDGDDLLEL